MADIKERLVKTEAGLEHQMEDETGKKVSVGFSMDQVMLMIKEMRKPDDETLRKKEEDEKRQQENLRQMIALHTAEEKAQEQRWANCQHTQERGETAWRGQVFSDGFYRAICLKCQMMSAPQKISPSAMAGMGLQ